MIESLEITDFRCFDHLKLSGLKFVNVLTGPNASGKTALLEAVLLGLKGIPTAVTNQINPARSQLLSAIGSPFLFAGGQPVMNPAVFEQNWNYLFGNNPEHRIVISYDDHKRNSYSLRIYYSLNVPQQLFPQIPGTSASVSDMKPIVFERVRAGKPLGQIIVLPNFNIIGAQQDHLGPVVLYFGPTLNYNETDNVTWYSRLRAENKEKVVEDALRAQFPFIERIEALSPAGVQSIWGILKSGQNRPLSLISAGISKIVSILLGAASVTEGVVMVDEFENGIFYEKYAAFWEALIRVCRENGNQLFVASHSAECLKELGNIIMNGNDKDFCLLRTTRFENKCEVENISGASVRDALKLGREIRG